MNSKDYLSRAYRISEIIAENMQELKELRQRRDNIPSSISGGHGSNSENGAAYTRIIDKIIDFENQIISENSELIEISIETRRRINRVANANLNLILKKRYLQFKTFEAIAAEMNYSVRHVLRLHGQALAEFAKENKDVVECQY